MIARHLMTSKARFLSRRFRIVFCSIRLRNIKEGNCMWTARVLRTKWTRIGRAAASAPSKKKGLRKLMRKEYRSPRSEYRWNVPNPAEQSGFVQFDSGDSLEAGAARSPALAGEPTATRKASGEAKRVCLSASILFHSRNIHELHPSRQIRGLFRPTR
jgi:hypothetical protein